MFQRHRLVFWYDAKGEWAEAFDAFPDENVVKLKVAGNEFGTKVRVVREPDPAAKFLLYVPPLVRQTRITGCSIYCCKGTNTGLTKRRWPCRKLACV